MNGNVITGANGRLDVYVSKAKDLPNLRRLDKQDPFVKLRIAHLTEVSPVIYRGGQTPKFDYHCVFQLRPDIKPLLNVELYDDHDHKHGSKLIGKCEVDLLPALLSDPEEGHDRWYELKKGSIEAGKVYIELTFIPDNTSDSRQLDLMEAHDNIESRSMPPLPVIPVEFHGRYQNSSEFRTDPSTSVAPGDGYTHGSQIQSSLPALPTKLDTSRLSAESNQKTDFTTSMNSDATTNMYHSQQTQSTEGIMDKLKLIKEKLNYFKNGSSEPSAENSIKTAIDLEVLQKVVGAGLESSVNSRVPTNMTGPMQAITKPLSSFSEPPLPPLPTTPSKSFNQHSRPSSFATPSSPSRSPNRLFSTPKLPSLPQSYSPASSRNGSVSPTRRRPPPM